MQEGREIMVNLGKIEQVLDQVNCIITSINKTLNDDKIGLKTRVSLLEQANGFRAWRERVIVIAVVGVIVKMILQ